MCCNEVNRGVVRCHEYEQQLANRTTHNLLPLCATHVSFTKVARRRMERMLQGIPSPPGSLPFFGHAFQLAKSAPWDTFHRWIKTYGERPANIITLIVRCPRTLISSASHCSACELFTRTSNGQVWFFFVLVLLFHFSRVLVSIVRPFLSPHPHVWTTGNPANGRLVQLSFVGQVIRHPLRAFIRINTCCKRHH